MKTATELWKETAQLLRETQRLCQEASASAEKCEVESRRTRKHLIIALGQEKRLSKQLEGLRHVASD
jgi:hypothetical protein